MDNPITDSESLSEGPVSFDPPCTGPTEVTIVHHNGSEVVSDFTHIEEISDDGFTIRVWYTDDDYTDYFGASISEVRKP